MTGGYGFTDADYSDELKNALIDVTALTNRTTAGEAVFQSVVGNALCSIARSLERLADQGEEG